MFSDLLGIVDAVSGVLHGDATGAGLATGQSDANASTGDAHASSGANGSGVAVSLDGNVTAVGFGIAQSESNSVSGGASATSAGIGSGTAVSLHGNATAVGLGIGQSDADALTGHAGADSHGVGTATAAAHNGVADATGMGIAQSSTDSSSGSADTTASGLGHGEAGGPQSVAVGAGTSAVVDIGHAMHDIPGEFGSIDLTGFGGYQGAHGGGPGSGHGSGHGVMTADSAIAKFEATVQHLMQEAHDFLAHGGDGSVSSDHAFDFDKRGAQGHGEMAFKADGSLDPAHGDTTRDVSFTYSQNVTLADGKTISLSFAYAEQDDVASGKAQIATGFGFAEGNGARSYATADAGFVHADAGLGFDSSPSLHVPDAHSYA